MGSCLCVARVPLTGPKRWDCGVVVGHTWNNAPGSGLQHLVSTDGPESVPFDETALHDLSVETYSMRPCLHRLVCNLMLGEIKCLH